MPNVEARLQGPSGADVAGANEVQRLVVSGHIPGLRAHLRSWRSRAVYAAGGVFALLSVACGSSETVGRTSAAAVAVATTAPEPTPSSRPTATSTREPSPTPESTATAIPAATPPPKEPEPTATATATATPEAEKGFDNGILSPKAYTKAEYITWKTGERTYEGIGIVLEAGEQFRIPENLQVAATGRIVAGEPAGYRITALRRNGSGIDILGDAIPSTGIDNFGKDLPAGTVIGTSGGTKITVLNGIYTVLIIFRDNTDIQKFFPDQTKEPPKPVENRTASNNPSPAQSPNQATIFFGVTPPTQR